VQRLSTTAQDTLLSWIIFPAVLLVYLLFPTKNYYWDGIFFARVIEDASTLNPSLLHPNHLLYSVIGYVLYKGTQILGLKWRAIEVLQVINCFVSVFTAFLLFRILRRAVSCRYLAWTLTLIFAFSATWWKFSVDANAYIPSVFFLLLAFNFILPDSKPRPLLVALLFCVAVLFHQLAVFCYPIFALGLWWQTSSLPKKQRSWSVIHFCLSSFVIVFATYWYCFYLVSGTHDAARFTRWVTSYSPDASFSFDAISNLGYTLRGHSRLFFNGRLSLLRGLVTLPVILLIVVLVALIVIWFVLIIRGLTKVDWRKLPPIPRSRPATLSALWILIYVVFLFFWLPQNTFYRLFYLPAIVLLLGEILNAWGGGKAAGRSYRLAIFAAIMFLSNFLFFIYPYSRSEKYAPLAAALEMNKVWQPGTIVYYASENSDNSLFQYFNRAAIWMKLPGAGSLDTELRNAYDSGKEVWLEASAIDQLQKSPEGQEWFARHARPETLHERRDRGYNIKFIKVR
jgi:hypothetical protein